MTNLCSSLDGLLVLVVEDDLFVADYTACLLEEMGCLVLGPAPSQDAAIRLLDHGSPDIAILDVNLQNDTTVVELARILKKQSIPIVYATGYEPSQIAGYLAEQVVQKPYTGDELCRALLNSLKTDRDQVSSTEN